MRGTRRHDHPELWSVVDMSASTHDVVTDAPESLVVLTHDEELLQTLRAVATDHDISTVGAEADLAAHLLDDHAGVAVLDTAAVTSPIAQLCDRLKAQFPDLVLVVAGRVEDQALLAAQITRGTVYRFLHKPVSEQRVRLFVDRRLAPSRRRARGDHRGHRDQPAQAGLGARRSPRRRTCCGSASPPAAALVLIIGWHRAVLGDGDEAPASSVPFHPSAGQRRRPRTTPSSKQLLARADAALRRGALTTPAGDNAVELYRQALQRKSDEPRATAGLERVMDRIAHAPPRRRCSRTASTTRRGSSETARSIKPDHVRVAFLTTQIGKERERALLAQARTSGRARQRGAGHRRAGSCSIAGEQLNVVAEARNEIAQRNVDDRVRRLPAARNDRICAQGALVEPAQNNARFFIESARAIAPNEADVRTAQRQLADRIVAQARTAITAGNAEEADNGSPPRANPA